MLYHYYTNKGSTICGVRPSKGFIEMCLFGKEVFIDSASTLAKAVLIYDRCLTVSECNNFKLKLGGVDYIRHIKL